MITYAEKYNFLAVKNSSTLLREITSNHDGNY